jgi:hypothetical protein
MTDLVVLVADKDMEQVVATLLGRRARALGIREIGCDVFVHPRRDPGCRTEAVGFLRTFRASHDHALVLFDRDRRRSSATLRPK